MNKLLRKQASALLARSNLAALVAELGTLYLTGSYALDLMTWRDLDMQLVLKRGISPSTAIAKVLETFMLEEYFVEGRVIHCSGDYKPHWPRGYCLNLKLDLPDLGGVWKLDLWLLSQEECDRNQELIAQYKQGLTESKKALILEVKQELMGGQERVPKRGSHLIYQAVLNQGLTEKPAIYDYLRKHDISI